MLHWSQNGSNQSLSSSCLDPGDSSNTSSTFDASEAPRGVTRLREAAALGHEDGTIALHALSDGRRLMLLDPGACSSRKAAWRDALAEASVAAAAAAAALQSGAGAGWRRRAESWRN